jgi:molecular chaperone IbpA
MVTFDWDTYTPYMLGFDDEINRINRLASFASGGSSYPPYNIISGSDNRTILEVALAGFAEEDIEVATEQNILTIRSYPKEKESVKYAHKGIASRSFSKSWQLGEDMEVKDVDYKNGMLTVQLQKIVPEGKQKKIWFSGNKELEASK